MNDLAIVPTRGSEFAAGLDLYSIEDLEIKSKDKGLVHTGIQVQIPDEHYG